MSAWSESFESAPFCALREVTCVAVSAPTPKRKTTESHPDISTCVPVRLVVPAAAAFWTRTTLNGLERFGIAQLLVRQLKILRRKARLMKRQALFCKRFRLVGDQADKRLFENRGAIEFGARDIAGLVRCGIEFDQPLELHRERVDDPIEGKFAEDADIQAGRECGWHVLGNEIGQAENGVGNRGGDWRLAESAGVPEILAVGVFELADALDREAMETPARGRPVLRLQEIFGDDQLVGGEVGGRAGLDVAGRRDSRAVGRRRLQVEGLLWAADEQESFLLGDSELVGQAVADD